MEIGFGRLLNIIGCLTFFLPAALVIRIFSFGKAACFRLFYGENYTKQLTKEFWKRGHPLEGSCQQAVPPPQKSVPRPRSQQEERKGGHTGVIGHRQQGDRHGETEALKGFRQLLS